MGLPPGEAYDDALRPDVQARSLQVPRLPQHDPVPLRRVDGPSLPLVLLPQRRLPPARLPLARHRHAPRPRRRHLLPRLTLWLRLPGAH